MDTLLSTTQVAKRLGLTVPRIQVFIWEGRLPAIKVGRAYAVKESDLKLVADRKPGRPPISEQEKAVRAAQRVKTQKAGAKRSRKPAKKGARAK